MKSIFHELNEYSAYFTKLENDKRHFLESFLTDNANVMQNED